MEDLLFKPIKINDLEIKNRIYVPALHLGMLTDFRVNDKILEFYRERAKGGAGIIVVGNATVDDVAGNVTGLGAHRDDFIPGLSKLAKSINENGARSSVQLNHAGRYSHSLLMDGKLPVAPSPIPSIISGEVPRELGIDEIKKIVASFADAAERVKKAGFDIVEVLSGTGYLISEFLSPVTNKRTDEYGGSFENRIRFGVEIIKAVRERVGKDYPLMVRLDNKDFMEGGQDNDELGEYAKILVEYGVDALCIKGNWHESKMPQLTPNVPRGAFAYLARNVKNIVDVPVIASHRIHSPGVGRELIKDGFCDMVAMGRSIIADPYMPEKARLGKEDEIIHCIACGQGCFDSIFKFEHVKCMCNPKAGFEKEKKIERTSQPKKVMVIGGGAAGMSAALAACEKGHDVCLYEKSSKLGGQLYLAATPPGREEFLELAADYSTQMKLSDVKVVLNKEVNGLILDEEKPDFVVLATGAEPITPPVKGVDLPHVVQAWDVLLGKAETGRKIVVIGGGAVGVETAMFLSEKGTLSAEAIKFLVVNQTETPEKIFELATKGSKEVTIIEMMDKIGKGIGRSTKWVMMQEMRRQNISARTGLKALEITDTHVRVQCGEETELIPADTVVLASGAKPVTSLEEILKAKGIEYKIAGDASGIALAMDAVHGGFDLGRAI